MTNTEKTERLYALLDEIEAAKSKVELQKLQDPIKQKYMNTVHFKF